MAQFPIAPIRNTSNVRRRALWRAVARAMMPAGQGRNPSPGDFATARSCRCTSTRQGSGCHHDLARMATIVDWHQHLETVEKWLARAHLVVWLAPPSAITAMTAAAGYLSAAPLYLLIPAVLGAAVFTFSLMDRLRDALRRRASALPRPIRELGVTLDRTDGHVKLGFVPAKNIRRLRIRLDEVFLQKDCLGSETFGRSQTAQLSPIYAISCRASEKWFN
jgi:hypothetical protein